MKQPSSLTRPFHLDRASLFCRCARLGEQGALGRRSAGGMRIVSTATERKRPGNPLTRGATFLCLLMLFCIEQGCSDKAVQPHPSSSVAGWRSAGLELPDAEKTGGIHHLVHIDNTLFAMDAYQPADAPTSRPFQWRLWKGHVGSKQWEQLKLPNGEIPNAMCTSNNKLFIGTKYTAHTLIYDPISSTWDSIKLGNSVKYSDTLPSVVSLTEFSGKIFISLSQLSPHSCFCWLSESDGSKGQIAPCPTFRYQKDLTPSEIEIHSMIQIGDALYGINFQRGIFRFHVGDSVWEQLPSARGRTDYWEDEGVTALGAHNGKMYVGYNFNDGIYRWDNGTWTSVTPHPKDGTGSTIRESPENVRVIASYQGRLFVAGDGCVTMYSPKDTSLPAFGDWWFIDNNWCRILNNCPVETYGMLGIGDTLYASGWSFAGKVPISELDGMKRVYYPYRKY